MWRGIPFMSGLLRAWRHWKLFLSFYHDPMPVSKCITYHALIRKRETATWTLVAYWNTRLSCVYGIHCQTHFVQNEVNPHVDEWEKETSQDVSLFEGFLRSSNFPVSLILVSKNSYMSQGSQKPKKRIKIQIFFRLWNNFK